MSNLVTYLKQSARSLARTPGFTVATLLILALGIGGTTAMFAIIHAALLKPLPYKDPDRLVFAACTFGGQPNPIASAPDYYDYREQADSFETLSAMTGFSMNGTVIGGERPERVAFVIVSHDLLGTLGVAPVAGRHFSPEEGKPGAQKVMMVSERFARRRFGKAGDAVGRSLSVDDQPNLIVGVMPATFHLLNDADAWVPMRRGEGTAGAARRFHNWLIVGRLKAGVPLEAAQRQVDVISKRLEQQYPDSNRNKGLGLQPLQDALVQQQKPSLLLLMAAVGLVLLIACGNVAGLLLARGNARRSELAVRVSIGASRTQLVVQLLIESVLLSVAAGVLGIVLAFWLQRLLPMVAGLEELGITVSGLGWPVLLFALVVSVLTGVAFGIVPALRGSSMNLAQDLASSRRSTDTRAGVRLRSALVVAQVAVSMVLLVGSGLMIRSFARLMGTNPGFDVRQLLTGEIELGADRYKTPEQQVQFFEELREDFTHIPGVTAVGFTSHIPIRARYGNIAAWAADNPPATPADRRLAHSRIVLPGYFEAMRMPLLAGRDFSPTDRSDTARVLVINELMAHTLFPDRNPLGQNVMVDRGGDQPVSFQVVGVVGNARIDAIGSPPRMTMYASFAQFPMRFFNFAIRTASDPESITATVRKLVAARDRDIPIENLVSMEKLIGDSLAQQRVATVTLALFSAVALLLAAIGLYGVLSFLVGQRTREIGVRTALGAARSQVIWEVAKHGSVLTAFGLGIGVIGSLALGRLLASQLFEVSPADPVSMAVGALVLAGVSFLATLVPAAQAAWINPVDALRDE